MKVLSHRLAHMASVSAAILLAACASSAPRYYTLVPPAPEGSTEATPAPYFIEVQSVLIPPQVDQRPMLIRSGDDQVSPRDFELWAGPLADEIRTTLATYLSHDLGAQDVYNIPHPSTIPTYRVQTNVRRFDSALGGYAKIDAAWSIQGPNHDLPPLTCESHASESVGEGYAALVEGHRRALAGIAKSIASTIQAVALNPATARCSA